MGSTRHHYRHVAGNDGEVAAQIVRGPAVWYWTLVLVPTVVSIGDHSCTADQAAGLANLAPRPTVTDAKGLEW